MFETVGGAICVNFGRKTVAYNWKKAQGLPLQMEFRDGVGYEQREDGTISPEEFEEMPLKVLFRYGASGQMNGLIASLTEARDHLLTEEKRGKAHATEVPTPDFLKGKDDV